MAAGVAGRVWFAGNDMPFSLLEMKKACSLDGNRLTRTDSLVNELSAGLPFHAKGSSQIPQVGIRA
ncbi:hypothetical protein KTAU_41680 [Thermogemmatispora aurantia]|nr:hypothetical protein KTAU_41680 [Thermogemmatispora aurantia]